MQRIVPAILSLPQHREFLEHEPVIYRPATCPHCGLATPWSHGFFARKADRQPTSSKSMNPVFIPRFFCQGCRQSGSRLPECGGKWGHGGKWQMGSGKWGQGKWVTSKWGQVYPLASVPCFPHGQTASH